VSPDNRPPRIGRDKKTGCLFIGLHRAPRNLANSLLDSQGRAPDFADAAFRIRPEASKLCR